MEDVFCLKARFQSTLPARGATRQNGQKKSAQTNFNPRSPHGERRLQISVRVFALKFQSTLPARGATLSSTKRVASISFQSTLPARGATRGGFLRRCLVTISIHAPRTGSDETPEEIGAGEIISIHAPRTGSDRNAGGNRCRRNHFNPRSPHGERQYQRPSSLRTSGYFNPRSPHGERPFSCPSARAYSNFNPRSPHGERHSRRGRHAKRAHFNPRSPHGERRAVIHSSAIAGTFQSTLPARGATVRAGFHVQQQHISIHAPRTGSDSRISCTRCGTTLFQSTLPARGATVGVTKNTVRQWEFQSTLPARGATATSANERIEKNISIHAPRTGSDMPRRKRSPQVGNFNPRSPHGERRDFGNTYNLYYAISIHAPRTGSDERRRTTNMTLADFNPRSPHGERQSARR